MDRITVPIDLVIRHRNIRSTVIESNTTTLQTHQRILHTSKTLLSFSNSQQEPSVNRGDLDDNQSSQVEDLQIHHEEMIIENETASSLRVPLSNHEALRHYHPSSYCPPIQTQDHVTPQTTSPIDSDQQQQRQQQQRVSLYPFISRLQFPKPLSTRRKLKIMSFLHAVNAIQEAKNIIVISGAGISVSSGIPDFRSPHGLYAMLKHARLTSDNHDLHGDQPFTPQDLFNISYFKTNPNPFYQFYFQMMDMTLTISDDPDQPPEPLYKPTPAHKFIKLLQDKGKLLRCYTQNIDGLERQVGLSRYVACHGNDDEFYCIGCNARLSRPHFDSFVRDKTIPSCQEVQRRYRHHVEQQQHANGVGLIHPDTGMPIDPNTNDDDIDTIFPDTSCQGVWKPAIVFFGEALPTAFKKCLVEDMGKADLILVMGTSLQVAPISMLPAKFSYCHGRLPPPPSPTFEPRKASQADPPLDSDLNSSSTSSSTSSSPSSPSNHDADNSNTHVPPSTTARWAYRLQQLEHRRQLQTEPIMSSLDFITRTFENVPIFTINRDRIPCIDLSTDDSSPDDALLSDGWNNSNSRPPSPSKAMSSDPEQQIGGGGSDVIRNRSELLSQMKRYSLDSDDDDSDDDADGDNGEDFDGYIVTPSSKRLTSSTSTTMHFQSYSSFKETSSSSSNGKTTSFNVIKESRSEMGTSTSFSSPSQQQQAPRVYSLKHPQLFDYEFIGNADDVCQLLCAILDWPSLI